MPKRAMSPVLAHACRVCFSKNKYFFLHYAPDILNSVKELSSIPKQISLSVIQSVFASLRESFLTIARSKFVLRTTKFPQLLKGSFRDDIAFCLKFIF
jgi:hypothetical protein